MTAKLHPGLAKTLRQSGETEARVRFVRARQAIGSQLHVAQLLGVSPSSLADWERGAAKVPGWALVAIERERAA